MLQSLRSPYGFSVCLFSVAVPWSRFSLREDLPPGGIPNHFQIFHRRVSRILRGGEIEGGDVWFRGRGLELDVGSEFLKKSEGPAGMIPGSDDNRVRDLLRAQHLDAEFRILFGARGFGFKDDSGFRNFRFAQFRP